MTQTDNITPVFKLSDSNPLLNTYYPDASKRTPDRLNGLPVGYYPYDTPVSKVYNWSLGVQRELPQGLVAELSYVGNSALDLWFPRDLNQVPEGKLGPGNTQLLRPFTPYQSIGANLFDGRSNYHGLQTRSAEVLRKGIQSEHELRLVQKPE